MENDTLTQLLRNADREASGPRPVPSDLPIRVRQLARQRRRQLVQSSVLSVAFILALGVVLGPQLLGRRCPVTAPAPMAALPTPSAEDELLAIKTEAEQLRAEILALQPAPGRTRPRPVAVARSAGEELERAAYLIVYQADRYHRELDMPESAIASYRQTIDLFPRTRAAKTARDRLSQIENTKGHES